MDDLDRHLSLLRDEGVLDSTGDFTTHLGQAREKMGVFQEANPAYCFLRWFQAAVAMESSSFKVTFVGRKANVTWTPAKPLRFDSLRQGFLGRTSSLSEGETLLLTGLMGAVATAEEVSVCGYGEAETFTVDGLAGESNDKGRHQRVVICLETEPSGVCQQLLERSRFSRLEPAVQYRNPNSEQVNLLRRPRPLENNKNRGGWYEDFTLHYYLVERWLPETNSGHHSLAYRPSGVCFDSNGSDQLDVFLRESADPAFGLVGIPLALEGPAKLQLLQFGLLLDPGPHVTDGLDRPGGAQSSDGVTHVVASCKQADHQSRKAFGFGSQAQHDEL